MNGFDPIDLRLTIILFDRRVGAAELNQRVRGPSDRRLKTKVSSVNEDDFSCDFSFSIREGVSFCEPVRKHLVFFTPTRNIIFKYIIQLNFSEIMWDFLKKTMTYLFLIV